MECLFVPTLRSPMQRNYDDNEFEQECQRQPLLSPGPFPNSCEGYVYYLVVQLSRSDTL